MRTRCLPSSASQEAQGLVPALAPAPAPAQPAAPSVAVVRDDFAYCCCKKGLPSACFLELLVRVFVMHARLCLLVCVRVCVRVRLERPAGLAGAMPCTACRCRQTRRPLLPQCRSGSL
jgi:hypothetical protein